jgi:flagellar biogenesis protein FliO
MEHRDRVSVKIIAILTLIFLPATFLAVRLVFPPEKLETNPNLQQTIFIMTFFDWNAGKEDGGSSAIVSHWIWLYFALSVALTFIVVLVWKAVSKFEERKRKIIWAGKIV